MKKLSFNALAHTGSRRCSRHVGYFWISIDVPKGWCFWYCLSCWWLESDLNQVFTELFCHGNCLLRHKGFLINTQDVGCNKLKRQNDYHLKSSYITKLISRENSHFCWKIISNFVQNITLQICKLEDILSYFLNKIYI